MPDDWDKYQLSPEGEKVRIEEIRVYQFPGFNSSLSPDHIFGDICVKFLNEKVTPNKVLDDPAGKQKQKYCENGKKIFFDVFPDCHSC